MLASKHVLKTILSIETSSQFSSSLVFFCTQIACGILQLGFITQFLSDSLVSGYTCAAAFTIAITQIRSIFGLPRDIPRGGYFANVKVNLM